MSRTLYTECALQLRASCTGFGFELVSQKGSHRKWRNIDRQLQVIVPLHKSRVPIGTLRNIMLGADIPESEWKA